MRTTYEAFTLHSSINFELWCLQVRTQHEERLDPDDKDLSPVGLSSASNHVFEEVLVTTMHFQRFENALKCQKRTLPGTP